MAYDPFVQLPWSWALSQNWTAGWMLSVYWPTEQARRNLTGETTFLLDWQLTKAWDAFVEYAGDFPEQGGPRASCAHQQLDLHGSVLSSIEVDHFIGIGYSFRWRAVRR